MHLFECVVHEPEKQRLKPNYFKKPPNKVTKENKSFWKKKVEVGGFICLNYISKYKNRNKALVIPVETSPNNSNV